jgi:hypothetical protein
MTTTDVINPDLKTVLQLKLSRMLDTPFSIPTRTSRSSAPVGVGKTFLAHARGHVACRTGRHRPGHPDGADAENAWDKSAGKGGTLGSNLPRSA